MLMIRYDRDRSCQLEIVPGIKLNQYRESYVFWFRLGIVESCFDLVYSEIRGASEILQLIVDDRHYSESTFI